MTLGELLADRKDAIADRWIRAALSVYPEEGSKAFLHQTDPFANPVGHRLRAGIRKILEALLDDEGGETIRGELKEILSVRAVQDLSASQALAFVFDLKSAIRGELGGDGGGSNLAPELSELDSRIDQVALVAFDIFVERREQVSELRVSEVKRQVSWIMGKLNAGSPDAPSVGGEVDAASPAEADTQGEGSS
ncbi:MAG: RsbRD N-terminal domain-containing protein [Candidatus Latescibacteria bacterium]|jgi:hypothetical protein|nr:RsbRD N-terminal domain-containing protein [Candidatus Latescibacterota bacterium]